jgi:peptidoglycan/LPS O-acetylase OafA/YrhL
MTRSGFGSPEGVTKGVERRFRPELQGLRALAVVLVVVYHVWINRVSGGVDVFFVISGFLLTGQLVRAADRGPIALGPLWSRTLTRLLPASLTVLLTTVVAGALLLPEGRWLQTVREVVASALFLQNWQLASDAVDYAAQNNTASVVQHFWSLSIQGQFFLVWPLLIALVALMARNAAAALRNHLLLALLAVTAASLSFSVALTASDQPYAYFHSLTRAWEFALGGLLALVVDRVVLARRTAVALGWVGVVGLVACGLVLQVAAVFPGYAALWPTGSAALVLLAGATGSRWGVDRILSSRPARYLGDLSYALYLWHWPLLLFYMATSGRQEVGIAGGAGVIAVSLVLAALTYHLVESPILRHRPGVRAGYRIAAVGTAAVLVAAVAWNGAAAARTVDAGRIGDVAYPGARALLDGTAPDPDVPLLPPMVTASEDWVRVEYWDCAPLSRFPTDMCTQPVEGEPERRIVLVGDSHVQQYAGALVPIAERRNWQLITILYGACPFSTASEVNPGSSDCLEWNAAAAEEIADLRPDAVVTLASRDVRAGRTEQTPSGFVEQWWRLHELGIPVLAMRDNPRFEFSPPDCIQQNGRGAPECGVARAEVYDPEPPFTRVPDVPPNVAFVDLADMLCDAEFCPAEIGNVLVYMDFNHLSATYARSMAPVVEEQLQAALGW